MSIYVSTRVWRSCPQEGDRLLLMLALADYSNDEGICWPSQLSLAKRCRCSERGVQRMVDALITEGELRLVRPGGGRGRSAVYQLETYSETGVLSGFEKGDPGDRKGDPGDTKGRKLSVQSVPEPKRTIKNPLELTVVEKIYAVYPRKVGKPAALKAIAKALTKADATTLLARTTNFAACWNGDLEFCPNPSTWFNQERYNDDPSTWKRHGQKTTGPSPLTARSANAGASEDGY